MQSLWLENYGGKKLGANVFCKLETEVTFVEGQLVVGHFCSCGPVRPCINLLCKISQTVGPTTEKQDWQNYAQRVRKMMQRFDVMEINYAKSAFAIQPESEIDLETGKITVALKDHINLSIIIIS